MSQREIRSMLMVFSFSMVFAVILYSLNKPFQHLFHFST
jgi:preprotein translocase subunit SecE